MSVHKQRPIKWPAGVKMLVVDIEAPSSSFSADTGEIIIFAFIHPSWKSVRSVAYDDFEGWENLYITDRDYFLCKWISEELSDTEIFIGQYHVGFDLPFINARLAYHGFGPLRPTANIDTYKIAKKAFNPGRSFGRPSGLGCSLANLSKFFKLKTQKGKIHNIEWRIAMTNDDPALMRKIERYCRNDVLTTRDLFQKVAPFGKIPHLHLEAGIKYAADTCNYCGSKELMKRGYYRTDTALYRQFYCKSCMRWPRGRKSLVGRGSQHVK